MDRRLAALVAFFGPLVAFAGVAAGLRTGSSGALVSGVLLGAGLLASGLLGLRGGRRVAAAALGLCMAAAAVMAWRMHTTGALLPWLPVGVVAVALAYALLADLRRRPAGSRRPPAPGA